MFILAILTRVMTIMVTRLVDYEFKLKRANRFQIPSTTEAYGNIIWFEDIWPQSEDNTSCWWRYMKAHAVSEATTSHSLENLNIWTDSHAISQLFSWQTQQLVFTMSKNLGKCHYHK